MIHLTKSDNKIVFKYLRSHNNDLQKAIKTRFFKKPFFIPQPTRLAYILIKTEGEDQEIKLVHEKLSNPTTYNDIGANIGFWTFSRIILLNNNIKYFCFEPSKINFYYLKKNFENFENFEIVKCALSNQCGTGTLSFPKWEKNKEREMNSGLLSLYGNTDIYCENVEIKTLDTCFLKKDLSSNVYLKIDVEGNEFKVLKGGENFLSQNLDITVQIELNFEIDNIIKEQ